MPESPGEHWCNVCEQDQSKEKGTYLKLYRKQHQRKPVIKILCPDCESKEKEMQEFIDAVDKRNYNKASNLLESLGAMQELGMDICEIGQRRK